MGQLIAIVRTAVGDGRWRRSLALAVAFAIGCGLLSWWQFARREESAHQNALVQANYDRASAVPLSDALRTLGAYDDGRQKWLPVELRGTYLVDHQLLVRDRQSNGNPGFEVLTPLRLQDGDVFVVDRGFLNVGSKQDRPDTVPAPPPGTVTVVARLQKDEGPIAGRTAPVGEIPSIDLHAVAKQVGAPTYTAAYGQLKSEDPAPAIAPQPLQAPSFGDEEGTHLSYAIQWILFAVIGFGALGWSVRRDLLDAGDPEVTEADTRAAERRRRRPRDEDVEDALLER
ncbi:SURF1 family protein [Amnibacterium sp. CER49]|uniref:SURF1 family cytochrome oxidase biogenesis protein n=1 Tax=Amnibacterium sp. CER49 TaxID=3039161 RepID=UPI002448E70F|nr:SURF1 family protein [Amnibacterium sp. CER49]MDH2444432.1 SURF1 family protein [Amnibacterium sp. CER49]